MSSKRLYVDVIRLGNRDPAPPGYRYVRNEIEAVGPTLLLPDQVVAEIAKACREAVCDTEEDFLGTAPDAGSKPGAQVGTPTTVATAAPSLLASSPKSANLVDPHLLHSLPDWPPDLPGVWMRIWDTDAIAALVAAHNEGLGGSDRSDRDRDSRVLRAILRAGPWRRWAMPDDTAAAMASLGAEFPHMGTVIAHVAHHLELARFSDSAQPLAPLLLVGAPGVGKTYFARRLAETLGTPVHLIDMAGQQTSAALHGSERHWSNSRPGVLFDLLCLQPPPAPSGSGPAVGYGAANPVVVLDEIDKVSNRRNGYDPLAPLHLALEPSTARQTRDLSTGVEFDASSVIYVATANRLSGLPDSLLSRFHIVHCAKPNPRETLLLTKAVIASLLSGEVGRSFEGVDPSIAVALAGMPPRRIKQLLTVGMARAAAAGRNWVRLADVDGSRPVAVLH